MAAVRQRIGERCRVVTICGSGTCDACGMVQSLSFGYDGDGELGARLLAAVLRGKKTATSSLAVEYLSGEPLPRVGERLNLVDHAARVHGVVETTRVAVTPLHLVDDQVAKDEGEGFRRRQRLPASARRVQG